MSRLDDELRRAAAQLAREPLPPDLLDEALDEPTGRTRWPGLAAAVAAGVTLVVAAGIGIGQVTQAPTASAGPSASAETSPTGDPQRSVTASTEELGIRLTVTLDRDRARFGERVWADATVENLGPGSVFWVISSGCDWPEVTTVAPTTPLGLEQGREDWPGDLGVLKDILTPGSYVDDRRRLFLAEEQVESGFRGCFQDRGARELSDGGSVRHRSAWDTDDYLGMPPVPGPYIVEVTFSFTRGDPVGSQEDSEVVSVSLPFAVEGPAVDWITPGVAVDALLSNERFVALLADAPLDRWVSQEIAFDGENWVVTLDTGTSVGDPLPDATLIGVVDARTSAVVDVRREERHIVLTTQPPVPEGSSPPPCPAALLRGGLVPDRRWGVAIVEEHTGMIRGIIWPFGYHLEEQGQRIAIRSEAGDLIAQTDDLVEIGGGEVGSDGPWLACGGIRVLGRY